jgi:hypothetical protein
VVNGTALIDDHGAADPRGVSEHGRDERRELPVVDERDEVGVGDHVPQFALDVAEVDVDGPSAQLVAGQQRLERLDRVPGVEPDMVILADAEAGEVVREPGRPLVQFAVGHLAFAAGHSDPVGYRVSGVLEQVRDVECHGKKLEPVTVSRQPGQARRSDR